MEEITLGSIAKILAFIVAFIGGLEFIVIRVNKLLDKKLNPIREELKNEKVMRLKTNLVNYQALIERDSINIAQLKNYYEEFDLYTEMGYNSFVHEGHERLKKEGKL